jgi:hypothetical protein
MGQKFSRRRWLRGALAHLGALLAALLRPAAGRADAPPAAREGAPPAPAPAYGGAAVTTYVYDSARCWGPTVPGPGGVTLVTTYVYDGGGWRTVG